MLQVMSVPSDVEKEKNPCYVCVALTLLVICYGELVIGFSLAIFKGGFQLRFYNVERPHDGE
jgi:hypothetical protein